MPDQPPPRNLFPATAGRPLCDGPRVTLTQPSLQDGFQLVVEGIEGGRTVARTAATTRPRSSEVAALTPVYESTLRPRRTHMLRPGWPLTGFLIGYPLWWLLGIDQILLLVCAAIMAVELLRRRRIRVQSSFGWWLLFLAWACVGVFLLQVDAPGAVLGGSNARYLTFAYRMSLYLAAMIFMLYVYNSRDRLSTTRIVRAFGWFFVTVVGGGVLGTVYPYLNFPSALEAVLPARITKIGYVHDLIHPVVAQVVPGGGPPRASAPFAYTNGWALAFACLLPFFVVGWLGPQAGWRRKLAPVVLLVATYPVVMSRNRGLWLALVLMAVLLCIRSLARGRVKFTFGFLVAIGLATALVASTPLGATVMHRLTTQGSEGSRGSLGTQTLASVTAASPVVGLGTTRTVQGAFYSIAGGDNPDCPSGCTPPPLGTQGHFWLLVFTTGWGGCLLYLIFIFLQVIKHIRIRTPVASLGIAVLLAHISTIVVYDTVGIGLCIILATVGLLWRERAEHGQAPAKEPTLIGYGLLVRNNRSVLAGCVLTGVLGGLAFQLLHGVRYNAISTVIVPPAPSFPISIGSADTMDSIAQLLHSRPVLDAASKAAGERISATDGRLYVTARTRTRLLDIHFTAADPAIARRVTRATATELLDTRRQLQLQLLADSKASVRSHRAVLVRAERQLTDLRADGNQTAIDRERSALAGAAAHDSKRLLSLETESPDAGRVIETRQPTLASGTWRVPLCSGAALGLLVGLIVALLRHARSVRIVRARTRHPAAAPVIATVGDTGVLYPDDLERTARILASTGVLHVLAPPDGPATGTANALEQAVGRTAHLVNRGAGSDALGSVAILADRHTRQRAVDLLAASLRGAGVPVAGIVLLAPRRNVHP